MVRNGAKAQRLKGTKVNNGITLQASGIWHLENLPL
jgi:hypothetical protein